MTELPLPLLVLFSSTKSGPARRMESVLAHVARKQRGRLRLARLEVDTRPTLVERFALTEVPTLVLVRGKQAVARLDGRVSAPQIERLLERELDGAVASA